MASKNERPRRNDAMWSGLAATVAIVLAAVEWLTGSLVLATISTVAAVVLLTVTVILRNSSSKPS